MYQTKMSRNVRDAYDLISESAFDKSPEMASLFARLEDAKQPWNAARNDFDRVRFRLDGLPAEIQGLKDEAAAIDAQRPAVVGRIVVAGDDDFAADDELLARRAQLLLKADRLAMARPALEREFSSLRSRMEVEARNVMELQDKIEAQRQRLRLDEAKKRSA